MIYGNKKLAGLRRVNCARIPYVVISSILGFLLARRSCGHEGSSRQERRQELEEHGLCPLRYLGGDRMGGGTTANSGNKGYEQDITTFVGSRRLPKSQKFPPSTHGNIENPSRGGRRLAIAASADMHPVRNQSPPWTSTAHKIFACNSCPGRRRVRSILLPDSPQESGRMMS